MSDTPDGETTSAAPSIPYEQAREELAEVVTKLEAGGTSLEESLALWERGEELAAICQQWLDGARARLQRAQEQAAERRESSDGE
ncbi:exodeoxyribonuclease VII small subunit [Mumia sp. DW29H23]|uniref:exodeoxyribonuclease VII small subunit n=1 Tax=Mumia sp. DW29H23 TaxID=3421241 RepID=UPI003D68F400